MTTDVPLCKRCGKAEAKYLGYCEKCVVKEFREFTERRIASLEHREYEEDG